jgi:arabinogalactan endo-1,4-beta-galactosidase
MRLLTSLAVVAQVAALSYKGVDWSSLLVEEAAGTKYSNAAGTVQPLETILKNAGVTTVRQRLWNSPSDGGNYDLPYNLKLGRRAKAAGLNVFVDFHFSNVWADPGHQATPSTWAKYDIDDLAYAVYNYTKDTMDAFQTAGVPVSLASIGNEITTGMLFPLGSIKQPANLARLLHSASSGIKDSTMSPTPKILLHLHDGWNYETQQSWYDTVLAAGPLLKSDFDVQAVSYYPFYTPSATLAALRSSLSRMRTKYGKDVMVVETDWPTSCPSPKYAFPADTTAIPFSAAGQTTWIKDVAAAVAAAGGDGFFYWEAAWLHNAALGSSCPFNTLFGTDGTALSSLDTFRSI